MPLTKTPWLAGQPTKDYGLVRSVDLWRTLTFPKAGRQTKVPPKKVGQCVLFFKRSQKSISFCENSFDL
jgi:hypothetical protein